MSKSTKRADNSGATVRKCPVTGLAIEYNGRGRPPKYHPSVKAGAKRKHAAGEKALG